MNERHWLLLVVLCVGFHVVHGDFKPEEYSASNASQFTHAIQELYKLHCTGYENILDVGCGDGKISRYIAQEYIPNGTLVGLDNDYGMIEFARSHARADNIEYIHDDIVQYSAPAEYDMIVSFWTLHWVTEYSK